MNRYQSILRAAALGLIVAVCSNLHSFAAIEADVLLSYAPDAASRQGGEDNIQVNLANALMGANALHEQSGTGVRWRIAGFYMSTNNPVNVDNTAVTIALGSDAAYRDVREFGASVGADLISYYSHSTGAAGNAGQPGTFSAMGEQWIWLVVLAHELGHNYGGNHQDDHLNPKGIMMHNYCGGGAAWPYFYSSPNIWQNGVQLIGDGYTCLGGGLVNGGDNAWTICSQAQSHADGTARIAIGPMLTNVVLRWCFTNAPGSAPASTVVRDLISGSNAVVRGVGAAFTGKGLRIPGGGTGNTAANSIAAYIDLPNRILSARTNLTIEIWATPLSVQNWARLCDFGRTVEAGDGLGAPGEYTGTPGTVAPGSTSASDDLMLSAAIGADLNAQRFESKLNGSATVTLDSGLPVTPGVQHHYAITFTDGAGAYGGAGGRWQWYRDAEPIAFLDVNHHLSAIEDVNNWLGRSLWSGDSMANNEYAEVRISNAALSRAQLLANYLLGPNYFPNANVTLNSSDAGGTTSFTAAGNWSGGAAPSAGNKYETFNYNLRTPATSGAATFAGDALTISGGQLLWKGTASSTVTINNFTLAGGAIANAGSGAFTLAGSLKLTNDNVCNSVNGPTTLSSSLSGNGSINFLNNTVTLNGNNSAFTGKTFVGCGAPGRLAISSEAQLGGNPAVFTADQLTLNRGWLYTTTTMAIANNNRGIRIGPSGGIFNISAGATLTLATPISSVSLPGGATAGLFIKENTGTLAVTGAGNTFNGPIMVSAGTLRIEGGGLPNSGAAFVQGGTLLVNSVLGAGAVTVSSGTLGGAGAIGGAVTVQNGATLAPGNNAIGKLAVANSVTLSGVTSIQLNKTAATNDQLQATGTLTYGGTLTVMNLSGTLAANDSFKLFNAASTSGEFTATNLPALGAGLVWNFNPATGVLSVVQPIATNPTDISQSVADGNLTLSWPADHRGWRLQVQTNELIGGLGTNWFDVFGSADTNRMSFPIDMNNEGVFYRLTYP